MILGYNLLVRAAAVWYTGSILRSILGSFIYAKYKFLLIPKESVASASDKVSPYDPHGSVASPKP